MNNQLYKTSKLYKYAVDYLSKYSSSKKNLERILKNKINRLNIEKKNKYILYKSIDEIINNLEKNNLINDIDYSSSKIRYFNRQGKSKIFIKSYLLSKGIKEIIIEEKFKDLDDQNISWEEESAKNFARKKRFSKNPLDKEKNLSKMARAGFSYDIAKKILDAD